MKFFAFIMSFYLLGLSCIPCNDSSERRTNAEVKVSASSDHQQNSHEKEDCTPFCSCACCAASAFFQPIVNAKTHDSVLQKRKFHFGNDDFQSYDFHSIWQPPQL